MSPEKALRSNEEDRSPSSPLSCIEVVENFKPRSRMQINRREVQEYQLKQMQDVEYKKKKDKLIDLSVGRHINEEAQY